MIDTADAAVWEPHAGESSRAPSIVTFARKLMLFAFGARDRVEKNAGALLTFDDGPDPDVTPAVLELLAKYDAKAVFFIVGNRIQRAPHILSEIVNAGHWIGNHSYRHPLDVTPSLFDYYRDVNECQMTIASLVGKRPVLFRPPRGSLTIGSLLAPRLAGLQTMLWSVNVDDWKLRHDVDAKQAGNWLAELASPGDIVLLHDDNPCVIPLLESALPRLRDRELKLNEALARLTCSVSRPPGLTVASYGFSNVTR